MFSKLLKFITPFFENKDKDRLFLLQMIPKGSICAEVGVWKGDFSKKILEVVKPKKLHLIDPWKFIPSYSNRWYGGAIAKGQEDMERIYKSVKKRFNDDKCVVICRDISSKAVRKFNDKYFDFVYIDGDHSYEYVKKDLEDYFPKVKKGGYITVDDYSFWKTMLGFGVKRAVDGFVQESKKVDLQVVKGQALLKIS